MRGAEWVGRDDQLIDELRMLRARAYGPDPDIHEDPSALSRLQDLERLARGPEVEELPPEPPLSTVPEVAAVAAPLPELPEAQVEPEPVLSTESADEDTADAAENPVEEPARPRKWTKKRIAVTWLASLGVAVLVTATVTGFVSRRIQADPREIAVLGVDPYAVWPSFFGNYTDDGEREPGLPEGGMAFQSFHGLAAFRMSQRMYVSGDDQTCLTIVDSAKIDNDSSSYSGAYFGGCAAGAFPATAEVLITKDLPDIPEELLEAFPEGTALQFVLDGDEVVVLSDQD